jgi:hypothetical protein
MDSTTRNNFAPALAAVGPAVKVLGKIKPVGQILEKIGNLKTTDNVLIRNRDRILDVFKQAGWGEGNPGRDKALTENRMRHKDIPNQKIGKTYDEEWARLYQFVLDTLANNGRVDLAEKFASTVPVFTTKLCDFSYLVTLLKGGSAPAAQKAIQEDYSVLIPFKPVMQESLKAKGVHAPNAMPELTQVFYNNVVAKKGSDYEPVNFDDIDTATLYNLDESLVDAVVTYIKDLQDRKNVGETLNPFQDRIATAANKVQGKITEEIKKDVQNDIGATIMNNKWIFIGAGALVLVVILYFAFRK